MIDTCPQSASFVRCTDGSWMVRPPQRCPRGHRLGVGRTWSGTSLAIVLAGIRLGRAWRAVAWCTRRRERPRAVSWLARPRCGNRGLSAGDRGRHRGADLVIINGVGDRYDALLAALAVAQVGGGAVEEGSGLAG